MHLKRHKMSVEKLFSVCITIIYSISLFFPLLAKLINEFFVLLQSQIKSFLFLAMIAMLCFNSIQQYNGTFKLPRNFMRFVTVLFTTILLFFLRVKLDNTDYLVWSKHFQTLGLLYVFFALFAYQFIKRFEKVSFFLHFIVYSGLGLSIIAIFQWIVGPAFLMALGLDLSVGGLEFTLGSAKDKEGDFIFRTFATLNNHYELGSILTVSTLSLYILHQQKKILGAAYLSFLSLMILGLLTTLNMTSWFILFISSIVFFKLSYKYSSNKESSYYSLKSKLVLLSIFCIVLVVLVKTNIGDRLVMNISLVDSSLAWRLFFMYNQITSLINVPFGLGWSYGYEIGKELPFMATSDNYFLWVSMLGGFPFYILFLYLFINPLWFGYKNMRKIYVHYNEYYILYIGIWCFVLSGVLCCFSNAFITNSGVSNYFFWIAVGLIYRIGAFPDPSSESGYSLA